MSCAISLKNVDIDNLLLCPCSAGFLLKESFESCMFIWMKLEFFLIVIQCSHGVNPLYMRVEVIFSDGFSIVSTYWALDFGLDGPKKLVIWPLGGSEGFPFVSFFWCGPLFCVSQSSLVLLDVSYLESTP